jgi:UDP-glucose 4-epimerase
MKFSNKHRAVLVTGGLGYIGSHTILDLIKKQYQVVVVDNLSNSSLKTLDTLKNLLNKSFYFYDCDIGDKKKLKSIFIDHQIEHVIHFAALKSVPDSLLFPEKYYQNNVIKMVEFLNFLDDKDIKTFIFSSSASVYGSISSEPLDETNETNALNPYSFTKIIGENILKYFVKFKKIKTVAILRYFNPIGNHSSGLLGDFFNNDATNIIPMIYKSLLFNKPFSVFGNNYNSKDGSPVRDFIHVEDLAAAHEEMISFLRENKGLHIFNVGLGVGITIKEFLNCYQTVNDLKFSINSSERRPGDIPICFADTTKITSQTKWRPQHNLNKMCLDAHKFYIRKIV